MAPLTGSQLTAVLRLAGTVISDDAVVQADAASSGKGLVKGFATIDHVALINVEGTGMVRPMQPHLHCIVACNALPQGAPLWNTQGSALEDKTPAGWPGVTQVMLLADRGAICLDVVQVGVPGTVSAIFSTVRDASANVIMISQASSEHSVCFAVKQAQGAQAVAALNARCAAWEMRVRAGATAG